MKNDDITRALFELADSDYRDFHAKLIPDVDKAKVIGVRTPTLRKYAKFIAKTPAADEFLRSLPHRYYDEDNLHAVLVSEVGDYNGCLREVERFLPYVDNWATCDMFSPKAFKNHKRELLPQIKAWLGSGKIYTARFAVTTLMRHYLDEDFSPEYLELVASVKSDEYYVKMAVAWYFATALAKQYDCAVKYIENYSLDKWTHNKTIQKARESFRITAEQKEYLNKFKL